MFKTAFEKVAISMKFLSRYVKRGILDRKYNLTNKESAKADAVQKKLRSRYNKNLSKIESSKDRNLLLKSFDDSSKVKYKKFSNEARDEMRRLVSGVNKAYPKKKTVYSLFRKLRLGGI